MLRLKRIAIGSLRLGDLAAGEYRPLRSEEVRELKDSALAASERPGGAKLDDRSKAADKRAGRRKPPDHTARVPAAQTDDAIARPQINQPERLASHDFDDDDSFEPPRRPGAIIGADESDSETPSNVKRRSATIKPIIDVRRGIFPARQNDDFDDDELEGARARPPVTPPTKPKRQDRGGPPRFRKSDSGRSKHPPAGRGEKRPTRRKGRRR